eukprot:jgi/Bigna1/90410/estExt_fgenesh1_pg.C_700017
MLKDNISTLLLSLPGKPIRIEQRKFSQSHVSIIARSSSHSGTKSSFRIETEGLGYFDVNDSVGTMSYEYPSFLGVRVQVNITNRVPWNIHEPDSDGPMGPILSRFPLPTKYYVHSFASRAEYAVSDSKSGEIIKKGMAFAHMEKNWGNVFPIAWMWSQAIGMINGSLIELVATSCMVSHLVPKVSVIALRAPNIHWDFRLLNEHSFKYNRYSLTKDIGTWDFAIESKKDGRLLALNFSSPSSSFSERLLTPTHNGFSNDTGIGAKESYVAHVDILAVDTSRDNNKQLLKARIYQAALEFGGEYAT